MGKVLDKVDSPQDLKKLTSEELEALAKETREVLIKTVAETGGHLAPNLGVVELTIGLHLALDSPKDKIIWDVGHQSYVHKLLTGRKDEFRTLRQYGGISGFPKRSESKHDVFDTGHASTSVSVALGLAEARDRKGDDANIVAVIGDGALTGGLSYEALNQAGHLKTRLIVVLNDNEMSIASNVGAMSSYLAKIRLDPAYNRLKEEVESRLKKIPAIGEKMIDVGKHMRDSVKQLLVPGMIFEEFGFKYIGPIDGHNIESVRENVSLAKKVNGPVLIHVLTHKGRGYTPAENSPDKFHGTAPFIVKNGEPKDSGKIPTYTEVFGKTMIKLAKENEKVVAITAAMASGTGLEEFAKTFPSRFYDVGIAEQHAVTFAAGLALGGFIPVVAIYSTFLERAYDQIVQDVALQNLHVIFAMDRGGVVGEDGPTHHGVFDISYLRHIPKIVVMAPKDENELQNMLYTATQLKSPVAVRYPRGSALGARLTEEFEELPLGKGEILVKNSLAGVTKRKNVAIIALGRMVKTALDTAGILRKKEISSTVVNARFAKPLDKELVVSVAKESQLIVTIEENVIQGGFGSAVLEELSDEDISLPVLRLGLGDKFITHGKVEELLDEAGLTPAKVVESIEEKLKEREKEKNLSRKFLSAFTKGREFIRG